MSDNKTHKHTRGAAKAARKDRKCSVEGCKNPYRAKGYCNGHYAHWRAGEYGKARFNTCSKPDCKKPVSLKGLCATHHKEWWTARHPEAAEKKA
ncbi:MAG: vegetative protein [Deltaproteobacteria bacterium]|nr:vegetative protein [Deltaproteobacteria bacterium]